ncbi:hypothetical protein FJT64_015903 [Amphibalanus amphitrite]|uniref:Uncharacterized protein n=1 Tax=Amphibalanus amphitrite TaxID=1232801 RepID=A0A6A4XG25_AMPAM|nr:hypothetical protein FJT64_020145 [Amphibalanus amphitrite]KAF0313572.1 hypothetical protein FJT64_015903 [Amphibalanus amphitrite]
MAARPLAIDPTGPRADGSGPSSEEPISPLSSEISRNTGGRRPVIVFGEGRPFSVWESEGRRGPVRSGRHADLMTRTETEAERNN